MEHVGAGIRHDMQALDKRNDIRPDLQRQASELTVFFVDIQQAKLRQIGFDVFVIMSKA